jgi:hypothetical protein
MRYIVVDEQDQKLLTSVASLINKATFQLDGQELVGAAQVLTALSRLAERIKNAEELPQQKKVSK